MLDDGGDVVVSRTHAFVVLDGRLVVHHESHVPHEECGEGDRERARYHQTSDDERGSFVVVKLGPARVEDFTRRKISEMVRPLFKPLILPELAAPSKSERTPLGERLGLDSRIRAAAPDTCGQAMEVPLKDVVPVLLE